jgi:hypothetical protein
MVNRYGFPPAAVYPSGAKVEVESGMAMKAQINRSVTECTHVGWSIAGPRVVGAALLAAIGAFIGSVSTSVDETHKGERARWAPSRALAHAATSLSGGSMRGARVMAAHRPAQS